MATKYMHIGNLRRLIVKALLNGGKAKSFFRFEWNVAGRCTDPQLITLEGREYIDRVLINPRHPQSLELTTKCRRCANCLWERQMSWSQRAMREYEMASRTWFGTLTLAPGQHHIMLARASTRLRKGGTSIERLGIVENFEEHAREVGRELTKYFKRLRKNYGASITYLAVTEPHKTGLPHYHLLIHERGKPLLKKQLVAEWQLGFCKFKLMRTGKAAAYVTKYLGKMKTTRVRASLKYGGEAAITALSHRQGASPAVTKPTPLQHENSEGMETAL